MPAKIRIVIAENYDATRAGLRVFLDAEPDLEVVGEAVDGDQVRELCRALKPEIVLLDLKMPPHTSSENFAYLQRHCPEARIVAYTAYADPPYVMGAIQGGARGYVLKDEDLPTLITALRTVAAGGSWFSPSIPPTSFAMARSKPQFKEREIDILRMIADGMTDTDISLSIHVSERTVRYYVRGICDKLGVDRRAAAIALAKDQGII